MDYEKKKVIELKELAKKKGIKGYSKLLKADLIEILKKSDKKGTEKKVSPLPVKSVSPINPKKYGTKTPSLSPFLSPKLSPSKKGYEKLYDKNIFLTPSLAFIYQICQNDNQPFLPKFFTSPFFSFSYDEAKECCVNINSPHWFKVKEYLKIFQNNLNNWAKDPETKKYEIANIILKNPLDIDFFFDVLKKEALEFQKGNLTLLHAKDIRYLVLDMMAQLTSGTYEGFKNKCKKTLSEQNLTALQIVTLIFTKPDIMKEPHKDHLTEIRKRIQSCNTTIFNNTFVLGESTIEFFYRGSVYNPKSLLESFKYEKKKMSDKQIQKVGKWMNQIRKIGKNCIQLYSFPLEVFQKYVYPAKPYGGIHDQSDLILNYQSYSKKQPWKDLFTFQYHKQMRIFDLCYTKYGYKDGVRFYQLTNIPLNDLEKFLSDLSQEFKKDKQLNQWFVDYIDIPEQKEKKKEPTKRILSYRSKKFWEDLSASLSVQSLSKEIGKQKSIEKKKSVPEEIEVIVEGDKKGKKEKELVLIPKTSPQTIYIPGPTAAKKITKTDYSTKKVVELKQIAKEKGIKGYSKMLKAELIKVLKD